jgi:hypothetical protein
MILFLETSSDAYEANQPGANEPDGGGRSVRTRSSGRISHETAPIAKYFEVNSVAITEKLINICP